MHGEQPVRRQTRRQVKKGDDLAIVAFDVPDP